MTCPDCGGDHPPLEPYLERHYVTATIWVDPAFVDSDTLRAALGLPDPLDLEREELAVARAERQTQAWKNPPAAYDPTSILDACVCGHDEATHYRGRGECMHATDTETWACACHEYRP